MKRIKVELDFIPVEERLPEYGYGLLAMMSDGSIQEVEYGKETGMWWEVDQAVGDSLKNVTHWAKIPEVNE